MNNQFICLECIFFYDARESAEYNGCCNRFPKTITKKRTDWCGEFVHKDYEQNWLRLRNNKLLKA